jgi:hypothetical protein
MGKEIGGSALSNLLSITEGRHRRADLARKMPVQEIMIALLLISFPMEVMTFFTISPFLGSSVLAVTLGWSLITGVSQVMIQSETTTSTGNLA